MTPAPLPPPAHIEAAAHPLAGLQSTPDPLALGVAGADIAGRQRAGRRQALAELDTFLSERLPRYRRGMDYIKPTGVRVVLHAVTLLALIGYLGWAAQVLWRL